MRVLVDKRKCESVEKYVRTLLLYALHSRRSTYMRNTNTKLLIYIHTSTNAYTLIYLCSYTSMFIYYCFSSHFTLFLHRLIQGWHKAAGAWQILYWKWFVCRERKISTRKIAKHIESHINLEISYQRGRSIQMNFVYAVHPKLRTLYEFSTHSSIKFP